MQPQDSKRSENANANKNLMPHEANSRYETPEEGACGHALRPIRLYGQGSGPNSPLAHPRGAPPYDGNLNRPPQPQQPPHGFNSQFGAGVPSIKHLFDIADNRPSATNPLTGYDGMNQSARQLALYAPVYNNPVCR